MRGSAGREGTRDRDTDDEQEIRDLMNEPGVDLIVADPCYRPLLEGDARFVPLPHTAMSARIHWDLEYEYAVDKGYEYLASQLLDD